MTMQNRSTRKKITNGLIWTFGERITAQLVSTLVTIVLARLLDPLHYGVISIVTVFISFCNVFVVSGFSSAIVQKKEVDNYDYNTAFIISFFIAMITYSVLFLIAPFIGKFYNMPQLVKVIRVMALRLPLASLNSIQQAHVQREMEFKRFFIATLFGTVLSGVVGIALAINGAGVWALVAQYLTNTTVDSIVLLFVDGWKPRIQFSMTKAKEIFSFGWKVFASTLVFTLEEDIKSLIVAKLFGPTDLAYYDQGKKYPALLVNNINTAINKVMLPAYSRSQDNLPQLKVMLRKSIQIGVFLLAPVMIGFAGMASTFVEFILTEKWLFCVPFIQIFCVSYLTRPLETACQQAILAIGRSDITLKIMIFVNITDLAFLLVATLFVRSIILIAIGSLVATVVSLICFMFYSNRLIGYQIQEQIQDITPSLVCAFIMAIVVEIIGKISISSFILMIGQIFCGACVYFALAKFFKINAFCYFIEKYKSKFNFGKK